MVRVAEGRIVALKELLYRIRTRGLMGRAERWGSGDATGVWEAVSRNEADVCVRVIEWVSVTVSDGLTVAVKGGDTLLDNV